MQTEENAQKKPEALSERFKKLNLKALSHLNAILQKQESTSVDQTAIDNLLHAERYLARVFRQLEELPEEDLTTEEAAQALGIKTKRVTFMLRTHRFPNAYKDETGWRIPKGDLDYAKDRKPGRPFGWHKE